MAKRESPEGGEVLRPPFARSAEVARTADVLKGVKNMAVINHKDLEEATGERYPSGRYYSIVNAAREILAKEDNIVFDNVTGTGYQRCDEHAKVEVARAGTRRIGRKAKKIQIILNGTDISVLTPDEKNKHAAQVTINVILLQATSPRFGKSVQDRVNDATNNLQGLDLRTLLPKKKRSETEKDGLETGEMGNTGT